MSEWKRRPTVSETHPFKEQYDKLLDMDREQLLLTIKEDIESYFECKEREEQEGFPLDNFFRKMWHENSIETFFWKFLNKETKVQEDQT